MAGSTDELVRETMPLVRFVVTEFLGRIPAHVRREDLESAGYEALVRCAATYDPTIGTSFAQYARIRVRGAVVDELRSADWASRGARRDERALAQAEDRLTANLGRRPSTSELAGEFGRAGAEIAKVRDRAQRAAVLSLEGLAGDEARSPLEALADTGPAPDDALLAQERESVLQAAVAALPERLRQVVVGYFLEERPMAELARELGVTESRISQLRAEALTLLKEGLRRHLDGEPAAAPEAGVAARRREAYYAQVAVLAGVTGASGANDRSVVAASQSRPTLISAIA